MNQLAQLPQPPQGSVGILLLPLYLLALPIIMLSSLLAGGTPLPFTGSYTNEEEWELRRGSDGRITGVTIHRNAREG